MDGRCVALPTESTAGRLAAAFPHARVVNVARSGARIGDVAQQLEALGARGVTFADLVLIHACANDVLEFRRLADVEHDFCLAIARAKAISPNVVVMPGHNFSVAPFFLRPMSWLIMRHAVSTERNSGAGESPQAASTRAQSLRSARSFAMLRN